MLIIAYVVRSEFLCILADNLVNNYLTKEIYISIIK